MMFRIQAVVLLATAVFAASCKKPAPREVPPVKVTVTPVIQKDVIATNQWVGLLDGFQNSNIQAQVTGYLLTQNYKEGSLVKKGDTLFTIDPRPFQAALAQAEADYASAVAKAQLQQITLQRQEQLYKTKVISEQEYQTSYQNTQAALASARPISLAEIKVTPKLADMVLVNNSRLSVQPVTDAQWEIIMALSEKTL